MVDNEQVEHRKEGTNSCTKNEVLFGGRQTIFVKTHQINVPLFSGEEFNERGELQINVEDWCNIVENHMNTWGIHNQIKRILEAKSFIKKNSPAYHFVHVDRYNIQQTWDELKKDLIGNYSIKNKHPLDIAQGAFEINWTPGDDVISYYYNLIYIFESLISVLNELASSEENKIPDSFINHLATLFIYNKLDNAHRRIFRKLWRIDMKSIEILSALKRIVLELESDKHRNTRYWKSRKGNKSNKARNFNGYNERGEPEVSIEECCDLVESSLNAYDIQNQSIRLLKAKSFIKINFPAYSPFAHINSINKKETWDELKKDLIRYYSIKNEHPLYIAQFAFEINWTLGYEVTDYYYKLIYIFESLISVLNELASSEENKIPDSFMKHLAAVFIYSKLDNAHQRIFRNLWRIDMTSVEILSKFKRKL